MKLTMHVVDAFTEVVFKGNSAAVIITNEWLADSLMQNIALENNLSETAFVINTGENSFAIRWFSPLSEIDFCGHATLAAAKVIFSNDESINNLSFFAQAVGNLSVCKKENGTIEMCFPNRAPKVITDIPDSLLMGLSIAPVEVLLSEQAYFAVYQHEEDIIKLEQNPEYIKSLAPYDVVVTASVKKNNSTSADFVSRYFWPANGGNEDPVTGSIHAGLAPYWAAKLGKTELIAFQASARGGTLYCRVADDKVYICGHAVKYLSGEITV